jgi:hypothetical protein
MDWSEILGLSVIGAAVTTIGTLAGLFLKEVVFVRSFERWKARRLLEDASRKYREPIALAAIELCNRLSDVCDDYPPTYLMTDVLSVEISGSPENSANDPHYQRYRLVSTVYRLCALLGWIELYRQDTTFLEPNEADPVRRVDESIFAIRSDLADGQLNTAPDWSRWYDALLFREEQRAIGECMIVGTVGNRGVMGYAQFSSLYPADVLSDQTRWIRAAAGFVVDPRDEKDFRMVRMQRLIVHLVDLVELVAPLRLREEHRNARSKHLPVVDGTA